LAITAFTEAEKLTAELASGAVSALRYLNTLLHMTTSSFLDYIRCVTCRRPCPVDGTMYVVNKTDELIPNIRLTVKGRKVLGEDVDKKA
ncbi:hypothetical protein COOONC_27133, partial [Cooperia oncophora]